MEHTAKRADRSQVADIDAVSKHGGRPLRRRPVLAGWPWAASGPTSSLPQSWPNGSLLVAVATASQIRPLRKPRSAPAWCPRSWRSSSAGVSRPRPSRLAPPAAELAFGRQRDRSPSGGNGSKAIVRASIRSSGDHRRAGVDRAMVTWRFGPGRRSRCADGGAAPPTVRPHAESWTRASGQRGLIYPDDRRGAHACSDQYRSARSSSVGDRCRRTLGL